MIRMRLLLPKDTTIQRVQCVHAWLLKGKVARIQGAALGRMEGIKITDASSAKDARPIEGPAIEAPQGTAEDDICVPNEFSSRLLGQAIKKVIGPVPSANA
jgi:hypothetical protein